MEVSDDDRKWGIEDCPGLTFATGTDGEELTGEFCFDAAWDESRRVYLINPTTQESEGLIRIQDCYKIRIVIPPNNLSPKLFEIGRRILANASKLGVPARDLHAYEADQVCPTGQFDMDGISNLPEFMDRPVLQFFF